MRERNHTARGLKSTCETRKLDREWKAKATRDSLEWLRRRTHPEKPKPKEKRPPNQPPRPIWPENPAERRPRKHPRPPKRGSKDRPIDIDKRPPPPLRARVATKYIYKPYNPRKLY